VWPEGRLVTEVSHGPLDHQIRLTYEGDDEPHAFFDASEHVVVRRQVVERLQVSALTTQGSRLFVGEYTLRQYEDMGAYGCELEARAVCKAAGVEFKTVLVDTI
jgi:hypothetical protein